MKKLLILFFATSLFVACNNNKKDDRRSDRDRDRERDDYRSRDDDRSNDRDRDRDADYNDNNSRDNDRNNNDRDVSRTTGWPANEVRAFISECVPEAAKNGLTNAEATDYCECMQQKIEREYPDINQAAKINMESPEMQQMVLDCAPRRN